jgi:hypothetical protein
VEDLEDEVGLSTRSEKSELEVIEDLIKGKE